MCPSGSRYAGLSRRTTLVETLGELPSEATGSDSNPQLLRKPRALSFVQGTKSLGQVLSRSSAKETRAGSQSSLLDTSKDRKNLAGLWMSWKRESIEPPPRPVSEMETGEDALRAQEAALKARARLEAKARVEHEKTQHKKYRQILTREKLREHNRETAPRRSRSASMTTPLVLTAVQGYTEGDNVHDVLYRFSWERNAPPSQSTSDDSSSVVSPSRTARGPPPQRARSRERPTSPSGSVVSTASRRSRSREPSWKKDPSEHNRRKGRGHRSSSVPTRRADGARVHKFIPAAC